LRFGDDGEKLVWYSRNAEPYLVDIQSKWEVSRIIVGLVSSNKNKES